MGKDIKEFKDTLKYRKLLRHLEIAMSLVSDCFVSVKENTMSGRIAATEPLGWYPRDKYTKPVKSKHKKMFKVMFDKNQLGNNIAIWLGAAWHEVAHMLWSPWSEDVKVTTELNLLEDARIEVLMSKRYPKTAAPLRALLAFIAEISIDTGHAQYPFDSDLGNEHLYRHAWATGRVHLSSKVRSLFRQRAVKVDRDKTTRIDEIFREYLQMGSNWDRDVALRLANELAHILELQARPTQTCLTSDILSDAKHEGDGDPVVIDPQDVEFVGGNDSDSDDNARPTYMDLKRQLSEDASEAQADSANEVKEIEHIVSRAGMTSVMGTEAVVPVSDELKQHSREIRRIAARFNDETGKGLVRRRDSGRFRPMRFEIYDDLDTAYDQWEPGLDQEMYVFILMDVSESMSNSPVNDVLYALEVGLSDVADLEIGYFNNDFWQSSNRNTDTHQIHINPRGGTDPSEGLIIAHDRLVNSSAANRLLVCLTDGQWHGDSYSVGEAVLNDLKKQGIEYRMIGLGQNYLYTIKDGVINAQDHEFIYIRRLEQLEDVVMSWTKTVLSK